MKQNYTKQLLSVIAMMVFGITGSYAYDFEVDGIYYNITDETNKEVEVTYEEYISSFSGASGSYSGDVVIPENVTYSGTTYCVSCIGDKAFYHCFSLASVEIPNTVTKIDDEAFDQCQNMTDVTIGDGVTSIGEYSFSSCTCIASVQFPDCLTDIGEAAFYNCKSLMSITIPSGVTCIGLEAFADCKSLSSIDVEEGNVYYSSSDGVLYDKDKATLIAYPAGKADTSFSIPSSVTRIEEWAFLYCENLNSVDVPSSVIEIGDMAFYYCTNMTSVNIPSGVEIIREGTFGRCTNLLSIDIPSGVIGIEDFAFEYCESLLSINIPSGVTFIGEETFWNCYSLTDIVIPSSVTFIGGSAFEDCTNLTSVTIGEGVTDIEYGAFYGCESLMDVYSLNVTPPSCDDENIFSESTYEIATLHVPSAAEEDYKSADVWKNFTTVVGDATGIENVSVCGEYVINVADGLISVSDFDGSISVYGINGAKVAATKADGGTTEVSVPKSGVYIVKISDGKETVTKKVIVQ